VTGADARLSIGIVSPTLSRSGGGIFPIVRAHARGLAQLPDASVTLYGLCDDAAKDDAASLSPVTARTYWPRMRAFGYAPDLGRDLARATHDVVHQHGLWMYPSIAVTQWRRRTGRPTVISTQGMLEPWAISHSSSKKRIAAWMFERRNLESAACIHCSEAEVAGVRAYGLTNPIAVLPNGIELRDERESPARPAWMPASRRTLLFLGRLHAKKGLNELLRAWSALTRSHPAITRAWTLAIAGWDDGGHAVGVQALARELGFSGTDVVFPGPLFGDDKEAALANADAFILPSFSEGFPMTALEAWAHALPILMTRECNVPAGFQAQAAIEITTDPLAMASVLASALARDDLAEIGRNGLALVRRKYTWGAIVADLFATYQWLAGRAGIPPFVRMD
jgi:glycosyltransferase involved in cell wall biosynthesis